ncbi:MAG: metallophosphoesterase [Clostridia bacterium]|nr:metallophosphoesterase [Clostridia bacterium]
MKRLGILFICLLLLLSFTACVGDTSTGSTDVSSSYNGDISSADGVTESELTFDIDREKSLKGMVSLEMFLDKQEGEYTLYYGDGKGNILELFTEIAVVTDGAYRADSLPLPYGAKTLVLDGEKRHIIQIPEEYTSEASDFVFGILSDVHYNRYYKTGKDDATFSFDNALDFFDTLGVDFVGVAGDISSNGEKSALDKFNDDIDGRSYPVYTVTGNHDAVAVSNGSWQEIMNKGTRDCTFAPNGLDFVYTPEEIGKDVFVFLNQVRWEYNTDTATILDMEQLTWLEGVLEENKNDTVYLFFHTFLCGPDGERHTGVGNIKNPGGYTYDLPYTYGNEDEAVFRDLLKRYRNVIYFSGHSHWMFEMEIYGEWANYSSYEGEYCHMIHVPSVTEPRYIGENDTARTGKNGEISQGWIAYDYEEYTLFIPVDFLSKTYYTEYIEVIYK